MKAKSPSVSKLKRAALELFAKRGIHGVTVRQIAAAAGQKNSASIGYHFGSKEALLKELVIDGAQLIDERRNLLLDQMESQEAAPDIRKLVEILVYPSIGLNQEGGPDFFTRFLISLAFDDRATITSALDDRWNSGYQRCLAHLRELMPDMPEGISGQRFVFMESYIAAVLAMRETRLSTDDHENSMWMNDQTLQHFIETIISILQMPHQ